MAQAPDQGAPRGGGAPRTNKTIKEFRGMNTREFRNAVPEGSFPWLENVQPIGPGNLHSIPGRGQSLTLIPPTPVPPSCVDATLRGQQHLVEELRFLNEDNQGGNPRTSWSYISEDEEVQTLVGSAACGGGNMTYGDLCCQRNHFEGPGNPVDHPALIAIDGFPAVNTSLGISDEPCYSFSNSAYRKAYFPDSDSVVDFESPTPPFGNFFTFAKKGGNFYGFNCTFGGGDPNPHHVWAWDFPGGNLIWESDAIVDYTASNAAVTDDFIYVLLLSGITPPLQGIAKLNRSDGSLVSIFSLDTIDPRVLFTVNDNLIYILNTHGGFYYLENFTDVVYVGSFASSVAAQSGTGFFTNSSFYYGGAGAASPTHIYRIPVPCPDGAPIIASVTIDAPGSPRPLPRGPI